MTPGATEVDILNPHSLGEDYIAAVVGGGIAALPFGGLAGAVTFGAVGNVASNYIRGNIHNLEDVAVSALKGAVANAGGYLPQLV